MIPSASSSSAAVPVKEGGQQESGVPLTGDSFIRPHLRKLSPYQPILPFEVNVLTCLHFQYSFINSVEFDSNRK